MNFLRRRLVFCCIAFLSSAFLTCSVQSQDFLNGTDLGDFSNESGNTTFLDLQLGDNVVSGLVGGGDLTDHISFTVAPGLVVSSITLDAFSPDVNGDSGNTTSGFAFNLAGMGATGTFTFDLDSALIDRAFSVTSIGDDLLDSPTIDPDPLVAQGPALGSLGEGDYAIRLIEGSGPASYQFTFVLESAVLLGDVNQDLMVDFSDIAPFIAVLSGNGFQAEADIDESGMVDFLDIAPFINLLTGS